MVPGRPLSGIAAMNKPLYEEDLYLWSAEQAHALRAAETARINMPNPIDWANVAEEIESLGASLRRELRSRLTVVIEHLLKLQASPAEPPRTGWIKTILRERTEIEYILDDSPSLRREVESLIAKTLPRAKSNIERESAGFGENLASALQERTYSEEQVIGDWLP